MALAQHRLFSVVEITERDRVCNLGRNNINELRYRNKLTGLNK